MTPEKFDLIVARIEQSKRVVGDKNGYISQMKKVNGQIVANTTAVDVAKKNLNLEDVSDDEEDDDLSAEDLIVPTLAASVISGENGKRIESLTKVRIYIDNENCGTDETNIACVLHGTESGVEKAKKLIQDQISQINKQNVISDETVTDMTECGVPDDTIPRVINIENAGRAGSKTVIWSENDKFYRGYIKCREKDKQIKTITCSYQPCKYSFKARAPKEDAPEFWVAANWDTLPVKQKAKPKEHVLILEKPTLALQRRTDGAKSCNITNDWVDVNRHRQYLKRAVRNDVINAHDFACAQVLSDGHKLSDKADAVLNSKEGRQLSSMAICRIYTDLEPDMVGGLPIYVRQIAGDEFYNHDLNEKLKWNLTFFLNNERTNELLSTTRDYVIDATFCTSPPYIQLGIIMAKLKSHDPRRQAVYVPVFWSFIKSKCLSAWEEFFDTFRSITPETFVMESIASDLESGIITSLKNTFAGSRHELDYWHLIRSWNSRLTTHTYLNPEMMKKKYITVYRLILALPHLPLHSAQVRLCAIKIIRDAIKSYKSGKNGKRSKMDSELDKYFSSIRLMYLEEQSHRSFKKWCPTKKTVGNAFYSSAGAESINRRVGLLVDKQGTMTTKLRGIIKCVQQAERNRLMMELNEGQTKLRSRTTITKSNRGRNP